MLLCFMYFLTRFYFWAIRSHDCKFEINTYLRTYAPNGAHITGKSNLPHYQHVTVPAVTIGKLTSVGCCSAPVTQVGGELWGRARVTIARTLQMQCQANITHTVLFWLAILICATQEPYTVIQEENSSPWSPWTNNSRLRVMSCPSTHFYQPAMAFWTCTANGTMLTLMKIRSCWNGSLPRPI